MKQKLLILLCALMTVVSTNAYDFEYVSNGIKLYFNIIDKDAKTCEITYKSLSSSDSYKEYIIDIPSTVMHENEVYTVTRIGNRAFYYCSNLKEVIIPETVTDIEDNAFLQATALTSITIPSSVRKIGNFSFQYCSKLQSINVENGLEKIGFEAFSRCSSLNNVILPNSVKIIEGYAFEFCENLENFEISDSIEEMEFHVLYDTKWLKKRSGDIYLGKNDYILYKGSEKNGKAIIKEGTRILAGNALKILPELKEVEIPNSVEYIGSECFELDPMLEKISFGTNVKKIGSNVFSSSTAIKEIQLYCENIPTKDNHNELLEATFHGPAYHLDTENCIIYVCSHLVNEYKSSDLWGDFVNIKAFNTTLNDGDTYTNNKSNNHIDITYAREFKNTNWQPLYVPFNMSYEEWAPYADVAEINGVHQFDNNDDGDFDDDVDRTILEFKTVKSGELRPNTPYVIRAHNTGKVDFVCTNKTLTAAPDTPGSVWCASTHQKYTLTGTYVEKTDMHSSGVLAMSGGNFYKIPSDATTLKPNRIYLSIENVDNGYGVPTAPVKIPAKVEVMVDGEVTGIEGLTIDTPTDDVYYDLTGRQVKSPAKGIYILNGKKVFVK